MAYNIYKVTPLEGETEMKALVRNHTLGLSPCSRYCLPTVQKDIYSMLLESREWYPEIFNWYFQKFVPGLNGGSRNILIHLVDNRVAGIALLKNEFKEKKICTFRVKGPYRSNGIGKTLFGKCLETLYTDKPAFTVPAERLCYFSNILKYYDFRLEQVVQNYYRDNSKEYVFNGYLDLKTISPHGNDITAHEEKSPHFNQLLLNHYGAISSAV